MMQLRKPNVHLTSKFFSVPGSEIANYVEIFAVSVQISGFIADFHRKLLDIVKQHPNNAAI